jgi:MFS family permease
MPEFYSFLICRVITGIGIGIFEIIGTAYAIEVNPTKTRAWYFVFLNLAYYMGGIYILALGFAIIPGLSAKLWRLYVGICVVPAFVSFVLSFFWAIESPRYQANCG